MYSKYAKMSSVDSQYPSTGTGTAERFMHSRESAQFYLMRLLKKKLSTSPFHKY